jgi:hypothetical protein
MTIKGDDGEDHSYVVIPHGAADGWPLGLKLLNLIAPVVGTALDSVTLGLEEVPKALGQVTEDLAKMAKSGFSVGGIGVAVGALAGHIMDDKKVLNELLAYTTRDGQQLTNIAAFTSAYQANYGELAMAIYEVAKANYGPFFARMLGGSSSGKLEAVMERLKGTQGQS